MTIRDLDRLTTRAFSVRLGVRLGTMKRWIHEGMPVLRYGRRVLVDPVPALDWIREHRPRTIAFHRQSVVYIARAADGRIKIGFTSDIDRRVGELRRDAGCAVEVVFTAPGDKLLEGRLLARFGAERVEGEWFHPAGDLGQIVADLQQEAKAA